MRTIPYSLWADLLPKPWREDARGPDAYDCVGFFLEIERRLGFPVPAYASEVDAVALAVADWELVTDPQPGDAILIRSLNPRWHIGVVCGDGYMLHSREGAGVAKERYNSFPWKARIEGFYRWKQVLSPL
jgi:cell wall-associated NlpC family hydrolase